MTCEEMLIARHHQVLICVHIYEYIQIDAKNVRVHIYTDMCTYILMCNAGSRINFFDYFPRLTFLKVSSRTAIPPDFALFFK